MGFISSGATPTLKVYLTQKGRDYLLNGLQEKYLIKYFSLGDSDTNYFIENRNGNGSVVDVTGDNLDCLQSIASNASIRYALPYIKKGVDPGVTLGQSKFVKLLRVDNNKFQNHLECVIYLDKLCRYLLYHASSNKLNPLANTFESIKSPIINFYNKANVFDKNNTILDDVEMDVVPDSVAVFKALSNVFLQTDGTTYSNNEESFNPLTFLFSSSVNIHNTRFAGSGKGGLLLGNRTYGYTFRPVGGQDVNNVFLSAEELETKPINVVSNVNTGEVYLNKSNFFAPAVKIRTNLKSSNTVSELVYTYNSTESTYDDGTLEQNFANQYCKAFTDNTPFIVSTGLPVLSNSEDGVIINEVKNLKKFIETSQYFNIISGSEYRTDVIGFSVKPKVDVDSTLPANIKMVFKFDIAEVLQSDSSYDNISNEGDGTFIEYLN